MCGMCEFLYYVCVYLSSRLPSTFSSHWPCLCVPKVFKQNCRYKWKSKKTDLKRKRKRKIIYTQQKYHYHRIYYILRKILQIVNFDLICYNIYFSPMDCNRAHMYYIIELTRKIVFDDPKKKQHTCTQTRSIRQRCILFTCQPTTHPAQQTIAYPIIITIVPILCHFCTLCTCQLYWSTKFEEKRGWWLSYTYIDVDAIVNYYCHLTFFARSLRSHIHTPIHPHIYIYKYIVCVQKKFFGAFFTYYFCVL